MIDTSAPVAARHLDCYENDDWNAFGNLDTRLRLQTKRPRVTLIDAPP